MNTISQVFFLFAATLAIGCNQSSKTEPSKQFPLEGWVLEPENNPGAKLTKSFTTQGYRWPSGNVTNYQTATALNTRIHYYENDDRSNLCITYDKYHIYINRNKNVSEPIACMRNGDFDHYDIDGDGIFDGRINTKKNLMEILYDERYIPVRLTKSGFYAAEVKDENNTYRFRNGKWVK